MAKSQTAKMYTHFGDKIRNLITGIDDTVDYSSGDHTFVHSGHKFARGLWMNAAGTIVVEFVDGSTGTFVALSSGKFLMSMCITEIKNSGSDAGIVDYGLW